MKEKANPYSLLTGVILIAAGFGSLFIRNNIVNNVSCSLLSSGIVIIITALLVERKRVSPLDEWGLLKIYPTRKIMNTDTDEKNRKAKRQIDAIGFGFKSFREQFDVEPLLQRGVNIRIITMDPESTFIKQRETEEGKAEGYIKASIYDLVDWAKKLNAKKHKGRIAIRCYDSMTQDFYWRVDDTVYTGSYWYDMESQSTISFCYGKGKGFDMHTEQFEKLWNDQKIMRKLI